VVFILSATQRLTATHGTLLLKRASMLQQLPLNLKSPIILSSRYPAIFVNAQLLPATHSTLLLKRADSTSFFRLATNKRG